MQKDTYTHKTIHSYFYLQLIRIQYGFVSLHIMIVFSQFICHSENNMATNVLMFNQNFISKTKISV